MVAIGYMAHLAVQVAAELAKQDLSVEVIDPRTLTPLDMETILASVRKTHKVVVVAEDCPPGGPDGRDCGLDQRGLFRVPRRAGRPRGREGQLYCP